jgi:hypothetical protein
MVQFSVAFINLFARSWFIIALLLSRHEIICCVAGTLNLQTARTQNH